MDCCAISTPSSPRRPSFPRKFAIALILLAACTSAPRVEPFGPGTQEVVERAHALDRAFLENNQKALDDLLAPEYQFHFIDHDMSAAPNAPRSRGAAGPPMSSSILDVRTYGPFAIVISHYTWARYEGNLTDVWIRRERKWQLLSSASS